MDKLPDIFKATVAVFHGIISTWLFLEFSETAVDQFQFLILLVFFTVGNVMIWGVVLQCYFWARGASVDVTLMTSDIMALKYRALDVAGLTIVAICVGLVSAYVHRHEFILGAANKVVNWQRSSADAPFVVLLSKITGGQIKELDARGPRAVKRANNSAVLRVYIKDPKNAYEGYPGVAASKRDPREVLLTPACRYSYSDTDMPDAKKKMEPVEGPGVFVRLVDIAAFEVIDRLDSQCSKIHDGIEAALPQ